MSKTAKLSVQQQLPFHPDDPVGLRYDVDVPEYPADWIDRPVLSFDLETTGVDPHTARIVTWSTALVEPSGNVIAHAGGLVYPEDFEVPEGAASVHGWTTEKLKQNKLARPLIDALRDIGDEMAHAEADGYPVLIFNAPYDATLFLAECERRNYPKPRALVQGPILDPLVLDKALSFRKGKRKLVNVAEHYGVELGDTAHAADADAIAAARVLFAMIQQYGLKFGGSLYELHNFQVREKAKQAASLQRYFREKAGKVDAVVDPHWPIIPAS